MELTTATALAELFIDHACEQQGVDPHLTTPADIAVAGKLIHGGMAVNEVVTVIVDPLVQFVQGGVDEELLQFHAASAGWVTLD